MPRVLLFFGIYFSFFPCFTVSAQRPNGRFLTDTIEIGKPFRYALSFRHSPRQEVFFPDTNAAFRPFEVIKLDYFPTETNASGSLDSAIYTLRSFDLKPSQILSVPVWVINGRDCTAVYSEKDTVTLLQLIRSNNIDTLLLEADTQIVPLRNQTNFPLILLGTLLIMMLGTVVYLFFGESLMRQWELYQMFLRNREFRRHFLRLTRDVGGAKGIENAEKAVVLWKTYLQRLERKPYATYTTKEIIDNIPNEQLTEALRSIDGVIYGGVSSRNTADSLNTLRQIAHQSYRQKRIEILQKANKKTTTTI
ncbi:MAG: hypothetical protein R2822_26240 [Spirosomataceae bacterium]